MKIAMEVRKISSEVRDHKDDGGRVGKIVEMYMTDRGFSTETSMVLVIAQS